MFKTERLILRPAKDDDYLALSSYSSQEEFYRYIPIDKPTLESTKAYVQFQSTPEESDHKTRHYFIIELQDSGETIGDISITFEKKQPQIGCIGYGINPHHWNKGYVTESARAIIEFGFSSLAMHRIYSTVHPDNFGSISVMKKCGMKFEGLHRRENLCRGTYKDRAYYAILDSDPR